MNLLTNKILLAILAVLLFFASVVAYNIHRANEYQRYIEKGMHERKPMPKNPNSYKLP